MLMQFEFSAGGVVFKKEQNQTLVLVAQHSGHHGWVFPKGHIDKGETKEKAAVREVQEETGVTAEIVQPFTPTTYWYVREKEKIKKTVYYFLMHFILGDITKHDYEIEKVEWLPIDEVAKRLTYKADKK